jgi:hypothetical protein
VPAASATLAARTGTDSIHLPIMPFHNRHRKLRNFRLAENNRPVLMVDALRQRIASFSFRSNCLTSRPRAIPLFRQYRYAALTLIPDGRRATTKRCRSTRTKTGSRARAGRDWPVMPTIHSECVFDSAAMCFTERWLLDSSGVKFRPTSAGRPSTWQLH